LNKEKASVFIAAATGTFSTIASIHGSLKSGVFSDHYLGLFCGITLIGTAWIHHMKMKQE